MRIRIQHPLFAGFLAVVGLLVVSIGLLAGRGLSRELRETFREELSRQIALAEWIVAGSQDIAADSLSRVITARIGHRVTLIDTTGVVLGDSYVDPVRLSAVENHRDRPEVRAALAEPGSVSFAARTSTTVGESLLYGARLTVLDGEPVILRIAAQETEIDETLARFRRAVVWAGGVAALFSLVAAFFLSRAFARPLVVLADRARRVTDGDFESRVPRSTVVELEDVAVAFNRLTDELQVRLAELGHERDEMEALIDCMAEGVLALTDDARLMRSNRAAREMLSLPDSPANEPIGSVVHHPELREALEESVVRPQPSREIVLGDRHLLLASRPLDLGGAVTTLLDISELRRLEEVRRDFVANASHELRTPLTAIRGFAETLLEEEVEPDFRRKFLHSIQQNTLRLQRLVEDLLDLSRLESGGWTAEQTVVDVVDAANEAWDLVSASAANKHVRFEVEGFGSILGDRPGLVHVFRNLMENAVRHTDEGGSIRVRVSGPEDGIMRIDVADDGEGIPARSLPRVFERFYRADSSRARDFGGTGLGLAIVRHLVMAMGGSVEAHSELGKGTTIRMELPRA